MGEEELLGCNCGTRDKKVNPWSTPVSFIPLVEPL